MAYMTIKASELQQGDVIESYPGLYPKCAFTGQVVDFLTPRNDSPPPTVDVTTTTGRSIAFGMAQQLVVSR